MRKHLTAPMPSPQPFHSILQQWRNGAKIADCSLAIRKMTLCFERPGLSRGLSLKLPTFDLGIASYYATVTSLGHAAA
jgi:hypothetical protein